MAKAPKMVLVALVLSLLALPAFGVRGDGLERVSFSSQPLNPLDHHPAGLIEVEAGTVRRETENEDECDKQLRKLEDMFGGFCEERARGPLQKEECHTQAKDTIENANFYEWQKDLAIAVLKQGKKPVFWAGFWPGGEEGIDTRKALAYFVSSVNGFQLADTEWGQVAESRGAKNLENCPWDRKKNWWNVASMKMAEAMVLHDVQHIIIALHKTLYGKYSFYKTVLYQAELPSMALRMQKDSTWNPQFELEVTAQRRVTVSCRTCTTLQACGPKQQVEKKIPKATCIEGNCQNGRGTKTYADGNKYQGEWDNGLRDGQGIETWADGNKYQGEWKNDLMVGQGTMTFASGQIYQGQWKKNDMWGQGTYTFPDGEKYQGGWKKDLKNGQGTYTYPNGDKYQGRWKKDLKDGPGNMTKTNGDQYEVLYKNGHLTKKEKKRW